MKPIISVEGLGKCYTIRHEEQTRYKSLREEIFKLPKKLLSRHEEKEEFWALKDVNFDIMPGDRVGIIGRNGAGKSTLLKLLSRITEPSKGRITMRGRVASLLEVGTGFHPELTGRENIYLNGAILGMTRAEVRRKFDEIVDFAGVEKFLDTPVKRYSSGMYVRLAFAVAAHLEPEILVVDEVLAVGDAEFQKKCLGKMEEVSKGQGRTVLFVSHNIAAVQQLCRKGLIFQEGQLLHNSDINTCVQRYINLEKVVRAKWTCDDTGLHFKEIKPIAVSVVGEDENVKSTIVFGERVFLLIQLLVNEMVNELDVFYVIRNIDGTCVYNGNLRESENALRVSAGMYAIKTELPVDHLNVGEYSVTLCATIRGVKWIFSESDGPKVFFNIANSPKDAAYWALNKGGVLAYTSLSWTVSKLENPHEITC